MGLDVFARLETPEECKWCKGTGRDEEALVCADCSGAGVSRFGDLVFSASYGSFDSWRNHLAVAAGYGSLRDYIGFGGSKPWQARPLDIILNHSGREGDIDAHDVAFMLPCLEAVDVDQISGYALNVHERFVSACEECVKGSHGMIFA